MSEIRKQKKIKGRSLPGPLHCAAHLAGRPSQRAAQPVSLLCRLRPDRGRGVWPARARATAPRHLSPCLPALPSSLDAPDDATPPPSLSLSHGRTPPSPPFATAAVSGHPSLPRLAQKLRHNPLFLPTAPRASGSPASPPRRRSPLRAPTIIAVEFAVSSASPSPLRRPLQPR